MDFGRIFTASGHGDEVWKWNTTLACCICLFWFVVFLSRLACVLISRIGRFLLIEPVYFVGFYLISKVGHNYEGLFFPPLLFCYVPCFVFHSHSLSMVF